MVAPLTPLLATSLAEGTGTVASVLTGLEGAGTAASIIAGVEGASAVASVAAGTGMAASLVPLVPVAIEAGAGAVASVTAGTAAGATAAAAGGALSGVLGAAAVAMPWIAAAMMLVSMVGGAQTARIQTRAARLEAEHRKRQSKAEESVTNSEASTARTLQMINNRRRMRGAEAQVKVMAENRERVQQAYIRGGLETKIQQAEAAGAFVAKVAQKGMLTSTTDAIENTMNLRESRIKYIAQKNQGQADWDSMQQIAGVTAAGYEGLEMNFKHGTQDNSAILLPIQRGTDWAGLAGQALSMYTNATTSNAQARYYERMTQTTFPVISPQARTG